MGIRDATGSEKIVILLNGVVRFAQFVVAVACLGLYGTERGYFLDHGIPARVNFELALGTMTLLTALVFGIIPFFMSYRPVALAAPWDLILMILWGAAFGLMKAIFLRDYSEGDDEKFMFSGKREDFIHHWKTMRNGAYINLAGLVLFLISGAMGAVLVFIGKRSGRSKASFA